MCNESWCKVRSSGQQVTNMFDILSFPLDQEEEKISHLISKKVLH